MTNVKCHNVFALAEGFATLADFGTLQGDTGVTEVVKGVAARPTNQGHVIVGTLQVKKLQGSLSMLGGTNNEDNKIAHQKLKAATARADVRMWTQQQDSMKNG